MIQSMLRAITEQYHLNAISPGEFSRLKISGMNFQIWAFHAEGLGHVSAMTATGFFGLMRMDTLIINPTERDLPLFSYDRVHAMGSDTLIFELYDTTTAPAPLQPLRDLREAYAALPDPDLGVHGYDSIKLDVSLAKKGKKAQSPAFDRCAMDYLRGFLAHGQEAPYCDPAEKKARAQVYVEGLLANGGPSTDVFRKGLGEEKTAVLFRNFLFGTDR